MDTKNQSGLKKDEMMKRKSLALCVFVFSATAAQAEGFYVVGAIGNSHVDDNISRSELEDAIGGPFDKFSHDKNDVAYKVQLGYQFNEHFAIEGGYVDLGNSEVKGLITGTFGGIPASETLRAKWEASGINLAGVLTLPITSGISMFFKAGAINAKVDFKVSDTFVVGSTSTYDSVSDSDTSLKANFGFGVSYNVFKGLGVRGEIERFNKLGDSSKTGEANVDLYSLGVTYAF